MSTTCIVLLAAGCSSRFGAGPKLLAEFEGIPLVRRAALAARNGVGVDFPTQNWVGVDSQESASLLVVTGAYADRIVSALDGIAATIVHNAAWEEGMGTSIGTAFRSLLDRTGPQPDAAIVLPADLPCIGAPQLQRLVDAHAAAPSAIVVSTWGERSQGPPCLFGRAHFAELSKLRGPEGARSVIARHAAGVVKVPMPEAAADIDTMADYERLRQ